MIEKRGALRRFHTSYFLPPYFLLFLSHRHAAGSRIPKNPNNPVNPVSENSPWLCASAGNFDSRRRGRRRYIREARDYGNANAEHSLRPFVFFVAAAPVEGLKGWASPVEGLGFAG
ncbi:MAG: hypothetical protein IJS32_04105 [Kiritimatiellae bacterium]|nr:hypothetical protein [Kiritimatiellia bacterium]